MTCAHCGVEIHATTTRHIDPTTMRVCEPDKPEAPKKRAKKKKPRHSMSR